MFFIINEHCEQDGFRLILANNRDEFWQRPTQIAHFWQKEATSPTCISGVDKEPGREGGTWFGASIAGRIACLVNISSQQDLTKSGRGFLVTDFLSTSQCTELYAQDIASNKDNYNGFHLTLIELNPNSSQALLVTNDREADESTIILQSGDVHSVGNSPVKYPWGKVCFGKERFADIVRSHRSVTRKEDLKEHLLQLMADKSLHWPDQQLEKQATECQWTPESTKAKSAICVWDTGRQYGTRTTTLLLIDAQGNCEYLERTLQAPVDLINPQWSTVQHTFQLQNKTASL